MKERLTHQKWSDNIDLTQEYGYSHIYKRLYELEDKIENGTLVELPIPLGTELHFLYSHEYADRPTFPTIHSSKKWTFEIWGNGKSGISCDDMPCGYCGIYQHKLGDTVFLTREEAEKRLKELKEEV